MSSTQSETYVAGATALTPAAHKDALQIPIPVPTLKQSFRLVCDLEPVRSIGAGLRGDGGHWINFTGGHFEGSFGSGEIVPGGQDSQYVMRPDHPSAPYSAQLSTRYLVKTHEIDRTPAYIQVQTRGWRTGPPEVMARLAAAAREGFDGVCPGPGEYKFRICIEMETDAKDEKYAWLNTAQFVGSGVRSGRQVIYDAWLIE